MRRYSPRLGVERLEAREVPAAGELDGAFAGDGRATTRFDLEGNLADRAAAVAVDSFGRAIAAGYATALEGNTEFALARYLPTGALDTTFSGDGKATVAFDLGGSKIDKATCVVYDTQGRIVVGGYAQQSAGDYVFALARLTPSGALDKTFSGDGKLTVDFDLGGAGNDRANALAIDSRGRIVLAGEAQTGTTNTDFAAARLSTNGALDSTFSGDGRATVAFNLGSNFVDQATGVRIDASDRVVFGGSAQAGTTDHEFAAARLTAAGVLDTTFSGDGKTVVAFDLAGGLDDRATSLVLDAGGKVYLAGYAQAGSTDFEFAVARLTASGAPDATFSADGKATVAFDIGGGKDDRALGAALTGRGGLVVVGHAQSTIGDYEFAVARFNPTGALDAKFSNDGKQVVRIDAGGTFDDRAAAVAFTPVGGVLLAGYANVGGPDDDFALARLQPDLATSAPDVGFSGDGKATAAFAGRAFAKTVTVDPLGRTLVGGSYFVGFVPGFEVVRFNPNGTPDTTFGTNGRVFINLTYGYVEGIAADALGRVYLAGDYSSGSGTALVVVRLTANGALDTTFGSGGVATAFNTGEGFIQKSVAFALDSLGRAVVVGDAQNNTTFADEFVVARFTANGVPDTSFGTGGVRKVAFDPAKGSVTAKEVAIDLQDRIVLGGDTTDGGIVLARLTTGGLVDTTFGTLGRVSFFFKTGQERFNYLYALQIDPRGRIVFSGITGVVSGTPPADDGFWLVRLNANGGLDSTFGTAGVAHLFLADVSDAIALAIDGYGRIVVGGRLTHSVDSRESAIAVLNENGTAASFGTNGTALVNFGAGTQASDIADLVVDLAGRIVVVGTSTTGATEPQYAYGLAVYS